LFESCPPASHSSYLSFFLGIFLSSFLTFFFLSFLTFLCVCCTIILTSFSGTDWGCEPPADLQDRMRNSLDAVANDGGARKRRRGWCVIRAFSGSSN
jgi:hypothetical protein